MTTLYRIREVSDLFVDACVRHPTSGELLFLSVYGRDGALLQFFAAFALSKDKGGLDEFTLIGPDGAPSSVQVARPDRLAKLTGKLPKGNLFGNLAQAWIYDPALRQPDRANRTAWGLYADHADRTPDGRAVDVHSIKARLWQQVRDLSPVPLADAWCDAALDIAARLGAVRWLDEPGNLFPPIGLKACRIELGTGFVDEISAAVRRGEMRIDDVVAVPAPPVSRPRRTASRPLPAGSDVDTAVPRELVY
jgi:hypothetical protein